MKGISSKTLAHRLQELEKAGILERRSYNEILPRVEYNLTTEGQEPLDLEWMRKWSFYVVAGKDDKNKTSTTIFE